MKIKLAAIIKFLLVVITILVWFYIIKYVVNHLNTEDTIEISQSATIINNKSVKLNKNLTHKSSINNPFQNEVFQEEEYIEIEQAPLKEIVKRTTFKIKGVINKNNKSLLILEDLDDNKTLFLYKGSKYKEIIIKNIDINKVVIKVNSTEETYIN